MRVAAFPNDHTAEPTPGLVATLRLPYIASMSQEPVAREYSVVVERDEAGWYVASVPALPGCHTQARSLDELMDRIREAIEAYIEAGDVPAPLEFVGVQRISIAA